jgi:hypothetical protein
MKTQNSNLVQVPRSTDKGSHDYIIALFDAILNPLDFLEAADLTGPAGLHKGAMKMNFDKWIDDLKNARKAQTGEGVHYLPGRSHQKFNEGGYTSIEYLAHSAKATGTENLTIDGRAL